MSICKLPCKSLLLLLHISLTEAESWPKAVGRKSEYYLGGISWSSTKRHFSAESKDVVSTALVISTLRPALGITPNEQMAWLSWILNGGLFPSMGLCYCPVSCNPISALWIFQKDLRWHVVWGSCFCSHCRRQLWKISWFRSSNISISKYLACKDSHLGFLFSQASPGHLLCFPLYMVLSNLLFQQPFHQVWCLLGFLSIRLVRVKWVLQATRDKMRMLHYLNVVS